MLNLKFISALCLSFVLSLFTSVTVLAVSSPATAAPEKAYDNSGIIECPCPPSENDNSGQTDESDESNENNNDDNRTGIEIVDYDDSIENSDDSDTGNDSVSDDDSDSEDDNDSEDNDDSEDDSDFEYDREPYPGIISVIINDDLLRIGSELSFTATDDPEKYYVQWQADGENIDGENGITYIVRPEDADKKITVVLISECKKYEGISPPTAYVPYTVILSKNQTVLPMKNDNAYFSEEDNFIAYAASNDNGFLVIDYIIHESEYGTDSIEFSVETTLLTAEANAGQVKYFADPTDAENGVITIDATFYHFGITIYPDELEPFPGLSCSYEIQDEHIIIIEGVGNYNTGNISLSITGAYPHAFSIDTAFIRTLASGQKELVVIAVNTGLVPPTVANMVFIAAVTVEVNNVFTHLIPIEVNVGHTFSDWIYDTENKEKDTHYRTCFGCDYYKDDDCSFGIWKTVDAAETKHQRTCTVCSSTDSHTPDWDYSGWSTSGTDHIRTLTCKTEYCNIKEPQSHKETDRPGIWYRSGANHLRDCAVSTCTIKSIKSHAASQRPSAWDTGGDGCERICTVEDCKVQTATHFTSHSAWKADGDDCITTCTVSGCGRPTDRHFTKWSNWSAADSYQHSGTCSDCKRNETFDHNGSLTDNVSYADISNDGLGMHVHSVLSCTVCKFVHYYPQSYCTYNSLNICVGSTNGSPTQNNPSYYQLSPVTPWFKFESYYGCGRVFEPNIFNNWQYIPRVP